MNIDNEVELNRQTGNLRGLMAAMVDEWPKAMKEGRQREWTDAVVAIVRMFANGRFDAAKERE